jgi:hypothetical protein
MGDEVTYGMSLERGTVLATFDRSTGKYTNKDIGEGGENHTVIFLGWVVESAPARPGIAGLKDANVRTGMRVVEQVRGPARVNTIWFDSSKGYWENAGRFNVVRLKN